MIIIIIVILVIVTKLMMLDTAHLDAPKVACKLLLSCSLCYCVLSYLLPDKHSRCKSELRTLVHKKREEFASDYRNKDLMENILKESITLPNSWSPRGVLVGQIYEHKDSVTRYS